MDQLTEHQNPANEPESKVIAREYLKIKQAGTVAALADKYGVSVQTIHNYFNRHREELESEEAVAETNDPVAPPSNEDVSEEAAPSVAQSA